jgi:membrane protein involved in colicin uptake
MPRKSLRPHLNQIRAWVRQGRTDAWVAHQLDVSVREIDQFKRQNELVDADDAATGTSTDGYPDEIDLRAEDDALIAAELEAAEEEAERAKAEAEAEAEAERLRREAEGPAEDAEDEEEDGAKPTRRRTRRGGRARKAPAAGRSSGPLEGTFDHGEEGYGLWLDPAIQDNAVYAEYWAGHRPVEVAVEEDQIVIRRVGVED